MEPVSYTHLDVYKRQPKRGVANATYMLSYDIGIGIGSLLMGFLQETLGLPVGFALTDVYKRQHMACTWVLYTQPFAKAMGTKQLHRAKHRLLQQR